MKLLTALESTKEQIQFAYHQLKKEPGLLQSWFPNAATANNPLQSQFLMKKLSRSKVKVIIKVKAADDIKQMTMQVQMKA